MIDFLKDLLAQNQFAIDGVAAGTGRIVVMITNHPEKLDPALIRKGRVDVVVDVEAPDAGQLHRLWSRFCAGNSLAGDPEAFVAHNLGGSMASAQDGLLGSIGSIPR